MITLAPIKLHWLPAERIDLRDVPGGQLLVAAAGRHLAVANLLVQDVDGTLHAYLETEQASDFQGSGIEQMARLDGVFGLPLTREQEAAEIAQGRC